MKHNALALALLTATAALPTPARAADDFCSRLIIYAINQFCQLLPNGQSLCQPIGLAGPVPGYELPGEPKLYQFPMGPASIQIPTFPYFSFGTNPFPVAPFTPHPFSPYSLPQFPNTQFPNTQLPYPQFPTVQLPSDLRLPAIPFPSSQHALPELTPPDYSVQQYAAPQLPTVQFPPGSPNLPQPAHAIITAPATESKPMPESLTALIQPTVTPQTQPPAQPDIPVQETTSIRQSTPDEKPGVDASTATIPTTPTTPTTAAASSVTLPAAETIQPPENVPAMAEQPVQHDEPTQIIEPAQSTILAVEIPVVETPVVEIQTAETSAVETPLATTSVVPPETIASPTPSPITTLESTLEVTPDLSAISATTEPITVASAPPATAATTTTPTSATEPSEATPSTQPPAAATVASDHIIATETPVASSEAVQPIKPAEAETLLDALAHFDFDSAELTAAGRSMLDTWLKGTAAITSGTTPILVTGHADRLGSEPYNQALSFSRAEAVKKYLTDKGIPPNRIKLLAHGETMPLINCSGGPNPQTIACLAPNRRAEVEALPVAKTTDKYHLKTANYPVTKASQKRAVKVAQPKSNR